MADLEDSVLRAKEDPDYRNSFLEKNKKFILTTAYRTLNRYVTDSVMMNGQWRCLHSTKQSMNMRRAAAALKASQSS